MNHSRDLVLAWQCGDNSWLAFGAYGACTSHAWRNTGHVRSSACSNGLQYKQVTWLVHFNKVYEHSWPEQKHLCLSYEATRMSWLDWKCSCHIRRGRTTRWRPCCTIKHLRIDAFQHKWLMAGSETQAFIQRTRSQSEDFVRCEMIAIKRFESRLQQEYECRIHDYVLSLQAEFKDHVGTQEMKHRAELKQTLQHESHVVTSTAWHIEAVCDQRVQEPVQNEARLEDNLTSEALEEMTLQWDRNSMTLHLAWRAASGVWQSLTQMVPKMEIVPKGNVIVNSSAGRWFTSSPSPQMPQPVEMHILSASPTGWSMEYRGTVQGHVDLPDDDDDFGDMGGRPLETVDHLVAPAPPIQTVPTLRTIPNINWRTPSRSAPSSATPTPQPTTPVIQMRGVQHSKVGGATDKWWNLLCMPAPTEWRWVSACLMNDAVASSVFVQHATPSLACEEAFTRSETHRGGVLYAYTLLAIEVHERCLLLAVIGSRNKRGVSVSSCTCLVRFKFYVVKIVSPGCWSTPCTIG